MPSWWNSSNVNYRSLLTVFSHPLTQRTRRIVRRVVVTCAVIVAVTFATTVTVDVGSALKAQAEARGSQYIQRPMHIGRLSVHLWSGRFVFENFVIEGLTPDSSPFLTAKRIAISMPWSTLINRRIVFDTVEMTDWRMLVEMMPDGRHTFPKLTRDGPRGQSPWTTTLQYVRAYRGEFTYRDHGTPWSVVTRNLDVTLARTENEYRGRTRFSNGTVEIQSYVPFRADMMSSFTINDGRVVFDRIDLTTDGAQTRLVGDVNLRHFPEQMYRIESTVDFPRMREIFFAHDTFSVTGTSQFTGTFHLFREQLPDGRSRTGRELKGTFESALASVNAYRFSDLRGAVRWVPEAVQVTDATAGFYGGTTRFDYSMAPLGIRDVVPTYTFDAAYENVDLTTFTDLLGIQGLRLAGRASGRNLLQWPRGRFADREGDGSLRVTPPDGANVMTSRMPIELIAQREAGGTEFGPFSDHRPLAPVPLSGELTYEIGREFIEIGVGRVATPDTYVEFDGVTAYGDRSRIPFHVTSADWQESDRLLAGILTAFGSRTNAIPIGGYGTFDGLMIGSFRRPRIEGTFVGEQMRAWDVVWGSARGTTVIENSYADVKDIVITSGDSVISADGRFSIGYPRRDGGEELNARVTIAQRPVVDLRRAFDIDDYDVDGAFSGEFHVYGEYRRPLGFGTMTIANGVAYTEPFDSAIASVRLEGDGVRLDNIQIMKGGGRGTGAAYVGWNGTYSFNLDGRGIAVESLAAAKTATLPLSGLIDFTAGGSGTFSAPRYDVRGTVRDFFVADEGIGQVFGDISINGELMSLKLEVASSRLALSGAGRISLTPEMDAELTFSATDTSLDPYIRAFEPRLSPFTTAVASGSIRVVGELANIDHLLVDVTVDRLDLSFFDYRLRNAAPVRIALDRHTVRLANVRLVGEDTQLDMTGTVGLHDERIAVRVKGDANLGILQGFVSNVRSTGRAALEATLEGPLREPLVNGSMMVVNGRIRHFGFPHALENISGAVQFDSRSIRLDELSARLGGGEVTFGGSFGIEGYQPGRIDVTLRGEEMRLRFPEGMRSVVDADLALQGTVNAVALTGKVTVRDALYTRPFGSGGSLLDLAQDATSQAPGTLDTTLPLRYDVQIVAPSTLQVRNNSVRLVASADLQLRGTYDRPIVLGRAEIERGEVTFEGKRYIVTRGSIDFSNPTRLDPFLDIETETRVRVPGETYRVTLRASGTFDRLQPTFEADPPLPQAQVLALLFSDAAPGTDVEFRQYQYQHHAPAAAVARARDSRVDRRHIL